MPRMPVGLAALTSLALALASRAEAQEPSQSLGTVRMTAGLGATIPTGFDAGTVGVNAQIGVRWWRTGRVAFRGDLRAQALLSGAVAIPSCVAGAPCDGFALRPDQVYSATLSAEARPFTGSRRFFGVAGAGAYRGRGPQSTSFGTTLGLVSGVGLDVSRSFVVELQYHYLPNAFGTLTGMLTPTLVYRF